MGQGGCQAIVDAAILDKCIGSTSTFEDAFRLFEQRRIDKTRRVILNSRRFGKIAQSENLFLIAIRNLLISLIPQKISAKQIMWLMEEF
jgi:2-polyprenyl-6-methoxyphenol hydroxylase-like FAD-dependent oxidoreductase